MKRIEIEILIEDLEMELTFLKGYKNHLLNFYNKINEIEKEETDYFTQERISFLKNSISRSKFINKTFRKEIKTTIEFLCCQLQKLSGIN